MVWMIPGFELAEFIRLVGILGVAFVVFAESGLFFGFFLPGDSLLFTTGILASQGLFGDFSIHFIVPLLFVAAVLGDSTGYATGKKFGPRLFRKKESLLFDPKHLQRAEDFYEEHGPKTIVIARFIPIIRTFAPIVAGIGTMTYAKFLTYNVIGALLWTAGLTYLGYFTADWAEAQGINIDHYLLPIIAVIIVLSILPPIIHILRDPHQRSMWYKQIRQLLRRFSSDRKQS